MIYVRDLGRMCNNLLQYGHAYAFAREHGLRSTSMRFCYKYPYFAISRQPRHNFLTYLWAKYAAKAGLLPVVTFDKPRDKDPDIATKEALMLGGRSIVAEGWELRHYDLFLKYRDEICKMFAFRPKIAEAVEKFITECETGDSHGLRLGVHIRRGDYARWNGGRYLYDDETYIRKIKEYAALNPGRQNHVYICGNDPAIDRERFRQAVPATHFMNGNPGEDLCLLSRCDAIIGPPSTFSLVAAMYRDIPLAWLINAGKPLENADFGHFDHLFRHII